MSELLDEIVASPARVSIRRNGTTEYLIRVNGHGFRMSNRGPEDVNEEVLPELLFRLADPEHMPGRNGRVEHTPDPARPGTLEGFERTRYLAPHRADARLELLGRNRQRKLLLHPTKTGRSPTAANSPVREGNHHALRRITDSRPKPTRRLEPPCCKILPLHSHRMRNTQQVKSTPVDLILGPAGPGSLQGHSSPTYRLQPAYRATSGDSTSG